MRHGVGDGAFRSFDGGFLFDVYIVTILLRVAICNAKVNCKLQSRSITSISHGDKVTISNRLRANIDRYMRTDRLTVAAVGTRGPQK